ncbi:hypothetical protein [Geobacter sp. DSM 9736]|uniref:hypothetical protein n=1 Tax=Geobacter sp. DSM 9736 TaxID=1277350 RepID=UPI000B501C45|nr:hypothetical protein [Geobacter sp. DSM 9736]SNB45197.1 hypothetical protein SAMN06269301_0600 [Geobacter sp. DSM 9736]
MKRIVLLSAVLVSLALSGCASKAGTAGVGVLGGAAAGGGAYEYRLNQEMQRIEDEHKAGKMEKEEYEARKDTINRLSIIK